MKNIKSILLIIGSILFLACEKETVDPLLQYLEDGEEFSGGNGTTFLMSGDAFGQAISGLTDAQENSFFVGNSLFNQNWVTAPASTTARDGLGPFFNARSCSGCHFKDGRGRAPEFFGEKSTGFLMRLHGLGNTANGAPLPDPIYGRQLQDQAILNITPEGDVEITYQEIVDAFGDGTNFTLHHPTYSISQLGYGALTAPILSPRVAPQMIGGGLLEAIPESDILASADELDADGDGISGKANFVWDNFKQEMALGRFGWKAGNADQLNQNAAAFIGDIGITSDIFPDQNCSNSQTDCQNAENGGQPEIIFDRLMDVVIYTQTLAVPARRDHDNPNVLNGKRLFFEIGCVKCHTPKFTTGNHAISALSGQVIRPYTDLLLHDMGDDLADGATEFKANGNEWRTPPLWGIGLIETVNGHTRFLHDGRAQNLTEAILWHGGEGQSSKEKFKTLTEAERKDLIQFLNSL
ncbi:MAG: c-type cytochrome [Bacteroidetes bacterium]|nr:c-type cytochrome [Bacteroidota bacterium]